jgi:phage terminase small subunit
MAEPAERMKSMRNRRRAKGLRELRDPAVRARIAEQVKNLDPEDEAEAMRWIEAVTKIDETR